MNISRREMHLLPFPQILKSQPKPIKNILLHRLKSVLYIIVTIPNDHIQNKTPEGYHKTASGVHF